MSLGPDRPSPEECIAAFPGYDPWRDAEDYEFIPERAEVKIRWAEANIKHTEGPLAGKPYIMELHQLGMQYMLWGWYHKTNGRELEDGTWRGFRRIKEAIYYCSRKGSKTTDMAVVMNQIIFTEPNWRMQNYLCASAGRQAMKAFNAMKAQINRNPEMMKRVTIYKVPASILRDVDESIVQPLPDNAEVEHGANVYACLCDEIHTYKNANLPTVMRTGMVAQDEPLLLYSTTAAHVGPNFCNDRLAYAKKVRDGIIRNPRFLPMIYEPDAEKLKANPDYWQTEECWKEANPMYGVVISKETMKEECQNAIDDPSYKNEFMRLLCNIQTESIEAIVSADRWKACGGAFPDGHFDGRVPVAAALDCGATTDATSFGLLFDSTTEDGVYESLWWHWMPKAKAMEHERLYGIPYSQWAEDGWITLTEGDQIDYDQIHDELTAIKAQYPIPELYFDPKFQSLQLAQQLMKEGWEITQFINNMVNFTAPTTEFQRLGNSKKFRHGDNPFMAYQISCAKIKKRNNVLMPDKETSGRQGGKIDGVVVAIMCVACALQMKADNASQYQESSFFVLK